MAGTAEDGGVRRYPMLSRKTSTNLKRTPFKLRRKRSIKNLLTPAEKSVKLATRTQAKEKIAVTLQHARDEVWKFAEEMAGSFGRTPTYWHRVIIQTESKKGKQRKTSIWNVFLHQKKEELSTSHLITLF